MAFSARFYQAEEPFPFMWSVEDDEDDYLGSKEECAPIDAATIMATENLKKTDRAWASGQSDNGASVIKTGDCRLVREDHEQAEWDLHMNSRSSPIEEINFTKDLDELGNLRLRLAFQQGEERDDHSNQDYAYYNTEMKYDLVSCLGHPSLEERFESTIIRLADSMRRSQETRMSLAIQTPEMSRYPRSNSINHVLHSVEESSLHLLSSLREDQEVIRRYSS
jgi:hypothetical protein